MKSINRYIKESVEVYRLNEVEATYNVQPEEIILQAPETFQESDIQQYMDDMWLNALPSSQRQLRVFVANRHQLCTQNRLLHFSIRHKWQPLCQSFG